MEVSKYQTNIAVEKSFWCETNGGSNKKFGFEKMLGQKKSWVRRYFGSTKNVGCKENLGPVKFSKKI